MPSEKSFPIYTKRHASGRGGYRVDLGVVNGKRSFKPFKTEHEGVIKLLNYAHDAGYKQECAALVPVLFCGVRVDEVERVTREQVKLNENPPVIVLDEMKANRRRVNVIPSNTVTRLNDLQKTGKIVPENYEGRMRYVRKKAGVSYKQNAARISFASYHVARDREWLSKATKALSDHWLTQNKRRQSEAPSQSTASATARKKEEAKKAEGERAKEQLLAKNSRRSRALASVCCGRRKIWASRSETNTP